MKLIVCIAGVALFAADALKITSDAQWTTESVSEQEVERDDQVAQLESKMLAEIDAEDSAEVDSEVEAEVEHDAEAEVEADHEAEADDAQEVEDKAEQEQDQEEDAQAETPDEQVNLKSDDEWIQYVKQHIDVPQLKEMMADSPCEMQVSAKCEGQKDEDQCLQTSAATCKQCEATRAGFCYPDANKQLHNDCESARPMCRMGAIFQKDASKYDQFNLGSKDKAGALAWWSNMHSAFCLDKSWESQCQH